MTLLRSLLGALVAVMLWLPAAERSTSRR